MLQVPACHITRLTAQHLGLVEQDETSHVHRRLQCFEYAMMVAHGLVSLCLLRVPLPAGLIPAQGPAAPFVAMDVRQHLAEEGVAYDDCTGFSELSKLMKIGK